MYAIPAIIFPIYDFYDAIDGALILLVLQKKKESGNSTFTLRQRVDKPTKRFMLNSKE